MGRSCINIGGNAVEATNVGSGSGIFKDKTLGSTLNFKTLSVTGSTMSITSDSDNIYFSAQTGGGGGGFSCGSNDQIPFMNFAGDDFDYSSNIIWDGCLKIKNTGPVFFRAEGDSGGDAGILMNQGGSKTHCIYMSATSDDWMNVVNGSDTGTLWLYTGNGSGSVVIGNNSQINTWLAVKDRNTNAHACTFSVANTGGSTAFNVRCDGLVYMPELPAKTSETDVLYVDGSGKLSCGAAGAGTSYWNRNSGLLTTANAGDCVQLDNASRLCWDSGSYIFGSTGASVNCICLATNSGAGIWMGNASNINFCVGTQVTVTNSSFTNYVSVFNSGTVSAVGNNLRLAAEGSISSADGKDVLIEGGDNSSTGNAGDVCLIPGVANTGDDGIVCIVGVTCATDDMCAPDFVQTSDERFKTNIQSYSPTKLDIEYKQFELCCKLGRTRYGVIAQDIQDKYSEVIRYDKNGYLSVSYIDLLIREVAYLKCKINELEKCINGG